MKLGRSLGAVVGASCLLALAGCATSSEAPGPAGTPAAADAKPIGRAQELLAMGDSAAATGDSRAAVDYYHQAALLGVTDPATLGRIGEAMLRERRWQDAADVYRRALAQARSDPAANRGYGRAMLALDQPGPAAAHLEEAVRADAADVRTLNMLGVAYDMLGRGGDAIAAYRRGLEQAPDDRSLANNLGLSLALTGDYDAAVDQLEPLANGAGSTAQARQNLALVYALTGDTAAAERLGRMDLDPATVRGNLAFAAAMRAGGDPAAATTALVTDLAVEPSAVPRKAAKAVRPPEAAAADDTSAPALASAADAASIPQAPRPLIPEPASAEAAASPTEAADAVAAADVSATAAVPAALALAATDMTSGLAPKGGWLIDLGTFDGRPQAVAAWRQLRSTHSDLLAGVTRLAGTEAGPQPLLVGPLESEGDADRICGSLTAQGVSCSKLRV